MERIHTKFTSYTDMWDTITRILPYVKDKHLSYMRYDVLKGHWNILYYNRSNGRLCATKSELPPSAFLSNKAFISSIIPRTISVKD